MQTILGAGGSIGTDLSRELSLYTSSVRLVSRNPKHVTGNEELVSADLLSKADVSRAVKGSEVVYLVAGLPYNLKVWEAQWPVVMHNVISACREHNARLVFFDNVYMLNPAGLKQITEETPMGPCSRKGKVREQLDRMILDEVKAGRLTALIARSADFYGTGIATSAFMQMLYVNLKKGKTPQWLGRKDVRHSFTYTPDAAKGTAMLGNTLEAFGQVWNLPTDANAMTIQEWSDLLADALGVARKQVSLIPTVMVRIIGLFVPVMREFPEMVYQFDREYFFDSSKFNRSFSFVPTPPQTALKAIVETLKDEEPA